LPFPIVTLFILSLRLPCDNKIEIEHN